MLLYFTHFLPIRQHRFFQSHIHWYSLDVIFTQAKRWENVVGRPEIQKFVGALAGQRAKKGVFITTSNFTKEAIAYTTQMDTKIVLIDGEKLSQYMIDYNLGVSVQSTYEVKKIDSDYFEEE